MFSPCLGDAFYKAVVLAQQSGASEINIKILLAAFDVVEVCPPSNYCVRISTELGCYASCLNNSDWTPVSPDVEKAIHPFDGVDNIDPATPRKALLAAK
ncbi:MAG: hypothetical protein JO061_00055 [Acidobacteriaceae bacterium]|nr:hypothetical protein [Acidobacteriaceae bacterium]